MTSQYIPVQGSGGKEQVARSQYLGVTGSQAGGGGAPAARVSGGGGGARSAYFGVGQTGGAPQSVYLGPSGGGGKYYFL